MKFNALVVTAAVLGMGAMASARDPIEVTATPAAGTPVTSSGDSLRPQLRDLIRSQGAFSSLSGQAYNATIKYGGVPNTIKVARDAAGTSATLKSGINSLDRTFTASTPAELENKVEDFAQKSADAYASLQAAVDRKSIFGVMDGNPRAATALMAD